MFYLLTNDGAISMCHYREGWVYAWHFQNGNVVGGGRINPHLITLKLTDGSWDLRRHFNLRVLDQVELEKDFSAWCDQWFKDDPKRPSSPSLIGETAIGKHQLPGGIVSTKKMF